MVAEYMVDPIELPVGHLYPWTIYSKVYWRCLPIICLVAALCYIDR